MFLVFRAFCTCFFFALLVVQPLFSAPLHSLFSYVDHSDRFLSFRKHFMFILVCILVALFYAKLALILTAVVAAAADDDAALHSIKAIFFHVLLNIHFFLLFCIHFFIII